MTSILVWAVLSFFAVGMTLISAISVKWAAFADGPLRASVVQFLLLMMAGMFVGVLVYFSAPGVSGVTAGLWVATGIMSASVFLVFVGFLRELRGRNASAGARPPQVHRAGFVFSVVLLVVLNEFLMGWSFGLLSGQIAPGLGPRGSGLVSTWSAAVTSPWFVFPMALEMLLTLRWLLHALPPSMAKFLLLQPAVMVCSPPTLGARGWAVATALGGSALMAVGIAYYLRAVFRNEPWSRSVTRYVTALLLTFGVMAGGLYLWVVGADPEAFALALLLQMVVFLYAVTDPRRFAGADPDAPTPPLPAGATSPPGPS